MNKKMRHKSVAFAALGAMSAASMGDVWFTHDTGVLALPPGPANGVFAQPDVNDVFFSNAFIRTAPGPNLGNQLLIDNPTMMGLLPGDNIDAIHHELRPLGTSFDEFPAFVFSVNVADIGLPGTAVRGQVPDNAADLYESNGFGYNVVDTNENQIGLAPGVRVDVDGFFLTPVSEIDSNRWVYFSLTPGSPTLSVLGASPADILSAQIGGTPMISIPGNEIGLERSDDDLDGLIMLHGVDGNNDGDFYDDTDTYPYIVFSVSPTSVGMPNTAVSSEVAIDPPAGGDVFSSIGFKQNWLIMDDGQYGLGLDDKDDVDGLDLPSMAVPAGHPLGTPFTGGFTTPGGPGTPGGPPLPPPGGTGGSGGPGCTPLAAIQFGLCVQSLSNSTCQIEVRVTLSCRTPGNPPFLTTGKVTVPCDNGDGAGVRAAVQALSDALKGLKIPNGPDAGKPVFAPAGGGVGGFGSGINGGAFGVLDVNGNLTDCAVKGVNVVLCGCDCYTQNFKVMSWEHELKQLMEYSDPGITSVGIHSDVKAGVYMIRFEETDEPHYIETPEGSAFDASVVLSAYFEDLGYKTQVKNDGMGFDLLSDPFDHTVSEVSGAGYVEGGTNFLSLEFHAAELALACPCDLNFDQVVDAADVMLFVELYTADPDGSPELDFDQSGSVDYFDLSEMINNLGNCQ